MHPTTWILRALGRIRKTISKGHILYDPMYIKFSKLKKTDGA